MQETINRLNDHSARVCVCLCVCGGAAVSPPFHQQQGLWLLLGKSKFSFYGFWKVLEMYTMFRSTRKMSDIKMIPGSYRTRFII